MILEVKVRCDRYDDRSHIRVYDSDGRFEMRLAELR